MAGRKHCKDKRSNPRSPNLIGAIWGDPDDVMETSLTIDYDKHVFTTVFLQSAHSVYLTKHERAHYVICLFFSSCTKA